MGLRCLLGHDYNDRQTEGEREDRGDEVVVTMREYRECARCGYRRIISENKEVKPNEDTTEDGHDAPTEPRTKLPVEEDQFEELSAVEDDGLILDEDDDAPVRGHGEWPAHDTNDPVVTESGPSAWPDPKGEDEGFSAEVSDGRPVEDVEFKRGGLTPQARAQAQGDGEHDGGTIMNTTSKTKTESAETSPSSNIRRARPSPSPTTQQRDYGVDTVFVCPECAHKSPGTGSSLRSGDICPECHQGYMVERDQ